MHTLIAVTRVIAGLILVVAMSSGCGGGGDTSAQSTPTDTIAIVALNPASAKIGVNTEFTVDVRYALRTVPTGVIDVGFFVSSTAVTLTRVTQIVQQGEGTVTMKVTANPSDYTTTSAFGIKAYLSESPHLENWTPLAASAGQAVTVVP